MAIKRTNVTLDNGIILPETYERITRVDVNRIKVNKKAVVTIGINIGMWISKDRSDSGLSFVEHQTVLIKNIKEVDQFLNMLSQDTINKAYAILKTHIPARGEPDYRKAEDV